VVVHQREMFCSLVTIPSHERRCRTIRPPPLIPAVGAKNLDVYVARCVVLTCPATKREQHNEKRIHCTRAEKSENNSSKNENQKWKNEESAVKRKKRR
jgi:hypothetical protein